MTSLESITEAALCQVQTQMSALQNLNGDEQQTSSNQQRCNSILHDMSTMIARAPSSLYLFEDNPPIFLKLGCNAFHEITRRHLGIFAN